MTAGVPGTGLGGLFYILGGLILPVRGVVRKLRGRSVSWGVIARLTGLALGVFLGIWLTGWLLGMLLGPLAQSVEARAGLSAQLRARSDNVLRWAALVGGMVTLTIVLLAVQVARFLTRERG